MNQAKVSWKSATCSHFLGFVQRLEETVNSLGSENIAAPGGKARDELMGLSIADQQPWQPRVSRSETWPLSYQAPIITYSALNRGHYFKGDSSPRSNGDDWRDLHSWSFPVRGLRVTLECVDWERPGLVLPGCMDASWTRVMRVHYVGFHNPGKSVKS